jgi:uncharacterized damage-inducible protein DinB
MLNTLAELFQRDLRQLATEISLYANESDLWIVKGEISNSAGNLCLHLIGNLNHFIGAALGNTGYVRDRPTEFAAKQVPRAVMLEHIEDVIQVVTSTLSKLSEADLQNDFPLEKRGEIVKTDYMLLHLFGHLSYHLGQINYHRRLV